jgi:6-phospho-beta-glucosidase
MAMARSGHARALVEMMKDVERTTIDAALLGSRRARRQGAPLHPLVPSSARRVEILSTATAAASPRCKMRFA